METDEMEFKKEWLSLDKYPFKILTVITILADSNGIFQGNLKDICKELKIQYNQGSKNRILSALTDLTQEKYICTTVDKDIYTISLAAAAEKNSKIIKIKRAWYQLIRETKGNTAWNSVLKTFLVIYNHPQEIPITYKEIGEIISLCETTVKNSVKILCSIDFGDFEIVREKITSHPAESVYICKGQTYTQVINFK